MTDLSQKGSVPVRYWVAWWATLAAAVAVFYVLLTPLWLGIRFVAWAADFRARRERDAVAAAAGEQGA